MRLPLLPSLLFLLACRTNDKVDAYLDTGGTLETLDADGDGYTSTEDCDDNNSMINPSAAEICDGVDNNCDGEIDNGVTTTFYADTDADGFGNATVPVEACELPDGYVPTGTDCDDTNPDTWPGAPEQCDGLDNDCDGDIDEDVRTTWYADGDGDGFGDPVASVETCAPEKGYVADNNDCDDTNADAFPGNAEVCDEADNDCDGDVDEGVTLTFYEDADGDGFGVSDTTTESCTRPTGYATVAGDCRDDEAAINPDAIEVCDEADNDCDGTIDEDDAIDAETFYADDDTDGYGDASDTTVACVQPSGYVSDSTDCDDRTATVNPGEAEVCDETDNDCNGDIDEGVTSTFYADSDGDGFGDEDASTEGCTAPSGYIANRTDCDDTDEDIFPGATEVCNDTDDDCDGDIDEGVQSTFYADTDGDGFGDADNNTTACALPSGHVEDDTDCDDDNGDINPDAVEVCDEADNNCDGETDGMDAWWDANFPYRIPLTLSGASTDVDGPPVAVDIDFRDALDDLGDTDTFDADSMRVVLQDCGLGQPELPAEFLDAWLGVFDKADPTDTEGNEAGAVVFLYDEDGDYTTLETLPASTTAEVAIYFGGTHSAPAYSTDLTASTSSLTTTLTDADFDSGAGGMLDTLVFDSTNLMSQTESCCGNSIYSSSWNIDPQDSTGTLSLITDGPVVAALQATGSRADSASSYDYTYTYWMFAGRPELYSRVHQVTTSASVLSHSGDYTSGIRPWESQSGDLTGSATFTVDSGLMYADASDGSVGVTFAYIQPPDHQVSLSFYDPYLIAVANDHAAHGSGTPGSLASGTAYFDHVVMMVLPHEGAWADVEDTLNALIEGVGVRTGTPEAR